jgi:hypothetical protein
MASGIARDISNSLATAAVRQRSDTVWAAYNDIRETVARMREFCQNHENQP